MILMIITLLCTAPTDSDIYSMFVCAAETNVHRERDISFHG